MLEASIILTLAVLFITYRRYKRQANINTPVTIKTENQPETMEVQHDYEKRKTSNEGHIVVVEILLDSVDNNMSEQGDDRYDLLEDAAVSEGGLIEFVQAFISANYKNECVLLKAGKCKLDLITNDLYDRSIKHKSDDDEYKEEYEDEEGKKQSLLTAFPVYEYTVRVNGNDIRWSANTSLRKIYDHLIVWDFVRDVIGMSEDAWTQAIFTDDFYRQNIFSNYRSEDTDDYVNALDVEESLGEMEFRADNASKPTKRRADNEFHTFETESQLRESPKKIAPPKKQQSSKEVNKSHGKLYKGAVKGFPIAVVEDGIIFEGLIPWGGKVLGNLTDGNVYEGIVRAGIPIATLSKGDSGLPYATKSIYKPFSATIIGYYQAKYIKTFPSGKIVANYEGVNEGEALATAFVLGLLAHE